MLVAFTLPIGAQDDSVELPAYTGGPAESAWGGGATTTAPPEPWQVIELFEAAYPDITVVGEPNGGTPDHFQIIDTQLAGNNAPDIIQFGGNWPDYQQYLEPLNDYLGEQLLIDTAEQFDQTCAHPRDGRRRQSLCGQPRHEHARLWSTTRR